MISHQEVQKTFVEPADQSYRLIGLLRIRNEALILRDTLDHLSQFCDGIVAYDDASTDATYSILEAHPKVLAVIQNQHWAHEISERLKAETEHRKKIMELTSQYAPEWLLCTDADERLIGDIKGFLDDPISTDIDGVRISLFDAYMTPDDRKPYLHGRLQDFRHYFGVERRDILMLFRCNGKAVYQGLDSREPQLCDANIITRFYAQHYGKAISAAQWEETCRYYMQFFPYETYGKKWEGRLGKAVHKGVSDFGTLLYPWGEALFNNAVKIH